MDQLGQVASNLESKIQVVLNRMLTIETTNEVNDKAIKNISGLLELKWKGGYDYDDYYDDDEDEVESKVTSADFAFIGNYYVHRDLLLKYNIKSDCHVTGRAIFTGDGKWKVFELRIGN